MLIVSFNFEAPVLEGYTIPHQVFWYGVDYPDSNFAIVSGGPAIHFEIEPALPSGVDLSADTGVIKGQPWRTVDEINEQKYTVTVSNPAGSSSFVYTMSFYHGGLFLFD